MGVRLPSEYQEVEYLEKPLLDSVAVTVYIDTDIITSNNIDYDFVGQALGNNETVTFFGGREAFQSKSNEVVYTLHHASVPTGAQFRYGNKAGATAIFAESPAVNVNAIKRYKKEGTVFTCNDSSSTTTAQTFSYNKTITLFDVNQKSGMVGNAGGTRIYYFKLYESGVLVRDYIPCYRKSDNEPGMYDLVSGTFFTNAGTGEFLVGPDVIDSISPWLVARRRMLMYKEPELYPVGTHILSMYIGNKENGQRRKFTSGYGINTSTGEYYATGDGSTYASDVYVPVSPKYTYQKNGNRLNTWCFYDKDKQYISRAPIYNNLNVQTLEKFPDNVCYVRIQAYNYVNQAIEITRIA